MNLYPVILVLVALGGIAISAWGWKTLAKSREARAWPTTTGVIRESQLTSKTNDLLPHIVFDYQFEGQKYTRVFEFPEGTHPLPEFSQSYLNKYPVGKEVMVYCQPQRPEIATLEPGAQGDWMILALGILMAVSGALTLLLS
ncbi:MAG: DUF3592 domain-containing protein [Gammaproteobacteria bacterium]|nr:DUF3592 domain-containing protein [Gammaproteobacteria bacterium]